MILTIALNAWFTDIFHAFFYFAIYCGFARLPIRHCTGAYTLKCTRTIYAKCTAAYTYIMHTRYIRILHGYIYGIVQSYIRPGDVGGSLYGSGGYTGKNPGGRIPGQAGTKKTIPGQAGTGQGHMLQFTQNLPYKKQ